MNMNRSPIAIPRPKTGMNEAIVEFIDTKPAEAEVPTREIPATTGKTMTMTTSAITTYSGLSITSVDIVCAQLSHPVLEYGCKSNEHEQ